MAIRAMLFLLLHAAAVFIHPTASVDPTLTPAASDGSSSLRIQHVESRTSSITVNWTSNFTYQNFQVLARSLTSGIVLLARPTNETEFTLTDLTVDTSYEICVVENPRSTSSSSSSAASLAADMMMSGESEHGRDVVKACLLLNTIPYIRVDSVLVLLGVVAFVVLSIAAAIFCWKCSRAEDTAAAADDYKDNGNAEAGSEKKNKSGEEQPLLDSDNNQYPQKNSDLLASEKVDSEDEPVVSGHQNSELPADGQTDKPVLV